MKSAFAMSCVVARKPAVFTTDEGPNRMPSRLMRNRIPVDDRAAARLIDDDGGATLTLDGRRAADHRGALGAGGSRRRAERNERRGREQKVAEAWMHGAGPATAERSG